MDTQVFTASGTWDWPEDIVIANLRVWSGGGGGKQVAGGGGGGAGGNYAETDVYKLSESSLAITVGVGGAAGADGGLSKVVQDSTDVCKAPGGKGATSATGAVNVDSGFVGIIHHLGGSGGNGQFTRGGGGGACASFQTQGGAVGGNGEDGEDAASPGGETNGAGGIGVNGGGSGGAGSNGEINASDGTVPGGGGGGANSDTPTTAGAGAAGKVVIRWGIHRGVTKHSSGCCCSICDLAKKFPNAVRLRLSITPTDDPAFDPNHDGGGVQTVAAPTCLDSGATQDITYPAADQKTQDQSLLLVYQNGHDVPMRMVDYESGYASLEGVGPGHYCSARYRVALAPDNLDDGALSGSPFAGLSDSWVEIGGHPVMSIDQSVNSGCVVGLDCSIESGEAWGWTRRSEIWMTAEATLYLFRTHPDGEFYFSTGVQARFAHKNRTGMWSEWEGTPDPAAEMPTLDGWEIEIGFAAQNSGWPTGIPLQGPYADADAAFEAAKAYLHSAGPKSTSGWTAHEGPDGSLLGTSIYGVSVEGTQNCEGCPDESEPPICSEAWTYDVSTTQAYYRVRQWYADPVTIGFTW